MKIEQISIQHNHIHLLIRTRRRSQYQAFFRVTAGQIAQRFGKEGLFKKSNVTDTPAGSQGATKLWRYRPFSRVVRGWKAYKIVRDYIQLNEFEVLGLIPYRRQRLRGLSSQDWEILWG